MMLYQTADKVMALPSYEKQGRVYVKDFSCPGHDSHGWVLRSRSMLFRLGYDIKGKYVHHSDGDTRHDGPFNLVLLSPADHQRRHRVGVPLSEDHRKKLSEIRKAGGFGRKVGQHGFIYHCSICGKAGTTSMSHWRH